MPRYCPNFKQAKKCMQNARIKEDEPIGLLTFIGGFALLLIIIAILLGILWRVGYAIRTINTRNSFLYFFEECGAAIAQIFGK